MQVHCQGELWSTACTKAAMTCRLVKTRVVLQKVKLE